MMNKHTLLYLSCLLPLSACTTEEKSDKPMNIIYILADDLGYGDLSCTGQTKFETPHIDQLAQEGMLFTQHYAGSTVSAPSRSALMTGQHTGHTFIRGNKELKDTEGQTPLPANTFTMAKMLKNAGYTTGAFGKWGLGFPSSEGEPTKQGFDQFFGYNCQREAHRYYPDHLWNNEEKVMIENNVGGVPVDYSSDLIHNEALKFMDKNGDKPFFLFLSYTLPHAELFPPRDSLFNMYADKFEEVPYVSPHGDYGKDMDVMKYVSQDKPYAAFAAMVARMDMYVGQVVAKLEELGIADNTMIMFTSDNGPHREGGANPDYFKSYGPFQGCKRDLTEGGIRLPLIVWAPGKVKAGVENRHICASWDMLPTFAELTGCRLPDDLNIDGISILPTLTGNDAQQKQHDYLYWEFHELEGRQAVRMGDWKAVVNKVESAHPEFSLYDLSKDIHEDHDVSAQHPEIVAKIKSIMHTARTKSSHFPFAFEK